MSGGAIMDAKTARRLLGVKPAADLATLTTAFREAARRTHPDRDGGDAEAFREVLDAYRFLRDLPAEPVAFIPAPLPPRQATVEIGVATAIGGGEVVVATADGRQLKLKLVAGLRAGQQVRAGGALFTVVIRDDHVIVRGDDLWLTAPVEAQVLASGGRIAVDTPWGRRNLWIDRKAADRKLIRLPGDGLPAAGRRRKGDLFVRLAPAPDRAESAAKTLLRRFAAAWAA